MVKNSSEFVQKLRSLTDANNYYMVSFDVENLYTNVPLRETIGICLDKLFTNSPTVLGLTRKVFKTMLELCVMFSFFIFNGKFYSQIDGLGMGLPLAPTLANLFLSHLEVDWIDKCPPEFRPAEYFRYVDDTFILFRNPSQATKFFDYMNLMHPNIKFTCENENNGSLNFLDVTVTRDNENKFDTSVYRKPTFTGLGTSYFSHCPYNFKLNGILTLINRAYNICSNFTNLHRELYFLGEFFQKNGYPVKLVHNHIRRFLTKKSTPDAALPVQTASKKLIYASLLYIGDDSKNLQADLQKLLQNFFPQIDLKLVFTNKFTIGSIFNHKDKLPRNLHSGIIYNYSCTGCTAGYLGSTIRAFYMREAEHRGVSYRTDRHLAKPLQSAIRSHSERCSPIRSDNFTIIDSERNPTKLRILESLHIFRKKPSLNDTSSAFPLKIVM